MKNQHNIPLYLIKSFCFVFLGLSIFSSCRQEGDAPTVPIQVSPEQQQHRINRLMSMFRETLNDRADRIRKAEKKALPYFTFELVRNERNGQVYAANLERKDFDDVGFEPHFPKAVSEFAWRLAMLNAGSSGYRQEIQEIEAYSDKYIVECSTGWSETCGDMQCVGRLMVKCVDEGGCAKIYTESWLQQKDKEDPQSAEQSVSDIEENERLAQEVGEDIDLEPDDALASAEVTFIPDYPQEAVQPWLRLR